jgi:hypothetical protein
LACGFTEQQELHYAENLHWFCDNGFMVEACDDAQFKEWVVQALQNLFEQSSDEYRIAVDVSSMSRLRMAYIVDTLREFQGPTIVVDFIYSIALFSPPQTAEVQNVHVGPVLKSFAGWSLNPDRPAVAILGLGYEENKALGAVEHLQVSQVWAFEPTSPIVEYRDALERANQVFFQSLRRENRISYRAEQPYECFVKLESLTERCLRSSGVVLLPFGPKIFAICALLVACVHPDAAVWRVSAGGAEPAADRVASSHFCGITAVFAG